MGITSLFLRFGFFYNSHLNLYNYLDKCFEACYNEAEKPERSDIMAKTLYSLMLSEEVVREVDKLAHRMGTNRSNLINSVLAEYVGFTTPERRISEILSQVEQLLSPATDLVPFLAPNSMSLSLKSALEYKYRPTVKYEVQLYKGGGDTIGELNVIFRTQSEPLLNAMAGFFRIWKQIEDAFYLPAGRRIDYALFDGRFTRSILSPAKELSADGLASALTDYLHLFDRCLKRCVSGRMTADEMRREYSDYLVKDMLYI